VNKQPISVSVVIPVYNGATTLRELVDEIVVMNEPRMSPGGLWYVVDLIVLTWDHGPDDSAAVIRELDAAHPCVRPVWLSRNFGQHPATCAGILATGSNWIVTMDEDGQHDPAFIPVMLDRAYSSRSQLVYAKPSNEPPHGFMRNGASRVAKRIFRWLMGADGDFHSYRLVAGEVGRIVAASIGPGVYLDVAFTWTVSTTTTVDIPMRVEGRAATSYDTRRLISHFWRLVLSSGTKPLRAVAALGMLSALAGFILAVVYSCIRLFVDTKVQGWTTLMVGMLIGGGIVLVSIGIIAEYIGMIAGRAMGRSSYVVVQDPRTAYPGALVDTEE
jgi:glycosyltransferase involved in cell wall biosynthesis